MRASQHRLLDELGLYSSNQVGGTAKSVGLMGDIAAEVTFDMDEEESHVAKVQKDLSEIRGNVKSSASVFSVVRNDARVYKGFFAYVPDAPEKENSPQKKRRK